MNYESFDKITSDRTIEALQKYIKQSDATVQYLKICRDVTSSFLKVDMNPNERIYKSWHGLFFFRIRRQFIKCSRIYTLKDNFITSNAFMCLEINARNLIRLIEKFRDEKRPECFLLPIFDSQGCENMFRLFRSMGTTNYTKINFTIYELMYMIGRLEMLNEISYFKLADKEIYFPNKRVGKTVIYNLPTNEEIHAVIARAKSEAIQNAAKLGMISTNGIDDFEIHSNLNFDDAEDDLEYLYDNTIGEEVEIETEFDTERSEIDENSRFVMVCDENGMNRKVLKSSLVWMLTEPSEKISNDRLKRVQIHNH